MSGSTPICTGAIEQDNTIRLSATCQKAERSIDPDGRTGIRDGGVDDAEARYQAQPYLDRA